MHQVTLKLPKITLEGSIMRLLILSSGLSIRKASAPTPRWRPSWLKLLMVTTMRKSSSLEASYREDVDTRALPGHATKYLGSYVIGENSMF